MAVLCASYVAALVETSKWKVVIGIRFGVRKAGG
jgi:hypothetical protein